MEINKNGILLVDKPKGITSHDVVAKLRKYFNTKKIGHSGTLDPLATGLLIVGVGKGTKLLNFLNTDLKRYSAEIILGRNSDSDDITGNILNSFMQVDKKIEKIEKIDIENSLRKYETSFDQLPSKISAKKINGKKAYDLQREGIDFELKKVPVTIYKINLNSFKKNNMNEINIKIDVVCSAGTYIRALARDLGEDLLIGGLIKELRRTEAGIFNILDAKSLDELKEEAELSYNMEQFVKLNFLTCDLTYKEFDNVIHGRKIDSKLPGKRYAVLFENKFVGILNEINSDFPKTDFIF